MDRNRIAVATVPLVVVATVWGLLLRVEALVAGYGPAAGWFEGIQRTLAYLATYLHPATVRFPHDIVRSGDPLAYLNNARAMTWFYQGRAREPVFNYLTKSMLGVTGDADIAVSLASMSFSILCIPAAYLLGRVAHGRVAGLLAAFVVAIEPDLIRWGVQGWRDDTFTFFVCLFVAGCLAVMKRRTAGRLALLSLAGAGAVLVRLTALSFVVPGFAAVLWHIWHTDRPASRRASLVGVATAAGGMFVLVAPYLVTCWLAFGDPLIAVNRNTNYYRAGAGIDASEPQGTGSYLWARASERPVAFVDQTLQGFTTYPFANKWRALNRWIPQLGHVLGALALAGMLAWAWTPRGRFLLLMLFSSMLPYVFTWQISAAWRFTMHTYPIYLVAAGFALTFLLGLAATPRELPTGRQVRLFGARAAASLAILIAIWAVLWSLPRPSFREAMRTGQSVHVELGWRDHSFFPSDAWYPQIEQRRVPVRLSRGRRTQIRLPLPPGQDYLVALRVFTARSIPQSRIVRVLAHGQQVARFRVGPGTPATGWRSFTLSAATIGSGMDTIELEANFGIPGSSLHPRPEGALANAETALAIVELWVHPDPDPGDGRSAGRRQ